MALCWAYGDSSGCAGDKRDPNHTLIRGGHVTTTLLTNRRALPSPPHRPAHSSTSRRHPSLAQLSLHPHRPRLRRCLTNQPTLRFSNLRTKRFTPTSQHPHPRQGRRRSRSRSRSRSRRKARPTRAQWWSSMGWRSCFGSDTSRWMWGGSSVGFSQRSDRCVALVSHLICE